MKKLLLIGAIALTGTALQSQMLYNWDIPLGAGFHDFGKCIADPVNNTVTSAGVFRNTVFFNPPGGSPRTATGAGPDMYVVQHLLGAFSWVVQVSGNNSEEPTSMVSDAGGNVYITGFFNSTPSDFDPATLGGTVSTAGGNDIFVVKYSIGGAFQWVRSFGSTGIDEGYGIAINPANGELLISGLYSGTVNFDAFALTSAGGTDGYFARLNATTGAVIGAYNIRSTANDGVMGICADAAGTIYTTGFYSTGADFDPGVPTVAMGTYGGTDIFVASYASTGAYGWVNQAGSPSDDGGSDIDVDGNLAYVTGYAGLGLTQFGALSWTVGGTGVDAFVASYVVTGGVSVLSPITGTQNEIGRNIAVDGNGYVIATGDFNSGTTTVDNKAGGAMVNLTNLTPGNNDFYITRYNSGMVYKTAQSIGGTGRESCPGLSLEAGTNNVYITGSFENTVDFDPNAGVVNRTSAGGRDIFIERFNWVAPLRLAASSTAENSFIYPNPSPALFTVNKLEENSVIEIYSGDGRLLQSLSNGKDSGLELNLGEYENGIYIVRIINASGSIRNEKLVLQH